MNRPWMPLWIADYLADTNDLSTVEHGAYLLLIMHYWQKGSLPPDDTKLARITRLSEKEWQRIRGNVSQFFTEEWKHKRIDSELKHAADVSEKRKEARSRRGQKPDKPPTNGSTNVATKEASFDEQKRTQSHSPSQKKEESSSALERADNVFHLRKQYAFEGHVIRLTQADFDKWSQAYPYVEHLVGSLQMMDDYYRENGGERWFYRASRWLAKENAEAKAKLNQAQKEAARLRGDAW